MSHGGKEPDIAPGDERDDDIGGGVSGYVLGLVLALGLTIASFLIAKTPLIWAPAIAPALIALAVAQMGIHLAFFLHITTGPDNTNNVLALAFGVLITLLILGGSLWIMAHLNHNMLPMAEVMKRMR